MTEEEKSKEGSSGSSEIVETVDKAIELDEKTQKRRLTLLNLAMQDVKMMNICEEEGINPRDTFRGFVSDEEGRKRLRIVTLGKEGEEKAKEMIDGLGDSDEWRVKNESVPRVEWEEMMKKKESDDKVEMVEVYPGHRLPKKEVEDIKRSVEERQKRIMREVEEKNKRIMEELKKEG